MKYCLPLLFLVVYFFQAKAVTKTEKIEKIIEFSNPATEKSLLVDNLNGAIEVTGAKIQNVALEVSRTTEAKSEEKLKLALEEVQLQISEKSNRIELFVDGPFRQPNGSIRNHGKKYYGYEVHFDFKIKVPLQTNLFLKTINHGKILVKSVSGDFEVKNINGGINLENISGAGEVSGINRDVIIEFRKNPEKECKFKTINGELKIYFPQQPQANFNLDTFNGEVYSDFPITPAYETSFSKRKKGERTIYKIEPQYNAASGKGGPKIKLKSLNGDIFILKTKK